MSRLVPLAVVLVVLGAATAHAQQPSSASLDAEARSLFAAGSSAFEDARYEDALGHFQRAYELSRRPALLYNVGLAADRLRRDRLALDSFAQFLAQVPEHPRRRDVEARVVVLRQIVAAADRAAAAVPTASVATDSGAPAVAGPSASTGTNSSAPAGAADASHPTVAPPVEEPAPGDHAAAPPRAQRDEGPGAAAVVGPITLGALGLTGVAAALVGLTTAGDCLALDAGTCVEERHTAWLGVGLYGGLGLASLASAVIWLVFAMSGGSDDDALVALTPTGLAVRWSL